MESVIIILALIIMIVGILGAGFIVVWLYLDLLLSWIARRNK